jgi:hypothetical protein
VIDKHSGKFDQRLVPVAGLLACIILLVVATTVLAAAVYSNFTGPTWTNPGYRWTVDVSSMTQNDKQVCIEYSINGGAATVAQCSCVGANCADGVGSWTCTAPNVSSGSLSWRVGAWTAGGGGQCGAESTNMGSGSFTTGPNALTLRSLQASPVAATALPLTGVGVAAVSLAGAAVIWRRRR